MIEPYNVFKVFCEGLISSVKFNFNSEQNEKECVITLNNKWMKNVFIESEMGEAVYKAESVKLCIYHNLNLYKLILDRDVVILNLTEIEKKLILESVIFFDK